MSRKRFVKLLMSKGFSRNEAQRKADLFNSRHISYKSAYALLMALKALKHITIPAISAARTIGSGMALFRHYD